LEERRRDNMGMSKDRTVALTFRRQVAADRAGSVITKALEQIERADKLLERLEQERAARGSGPPAVGAKESPHR
jgi:hypothetical protein